MTGQQIQAQYEWPYPSEVTLVACSNDGKRVAFGGGVEPIEFWERHGEHWSHLFSYIFPQGELPPFAFSPDGVKFAVASPDRREIQVYLTATGQQTASFFLPRGRTTIITWSPGGKVTSGADDGWVYIWDFAKAYEEWAFCLASKVNDRATDGKPILAIDWVADGSMMAVREEGDPFVRVHHEHQGWLETTYHHGIELVQAMSWSPDSKRIALAIGANIEIRDRRRRDKPLLIYSGHAAPVVVACWSHDGKFVLSLSCDGVLQVWNATTGNLVSHLDSLDIRSLAVSHDGHVLVGRRTREAQLFDLLKLVGYRVCGEESRELTNPLKWTYIRCASCMNNDELKEHQQDASVERLYQIEAGDLVCDTCHTYLTTGRPAPTGNILKDFFAIDLGELLEELNVDGWAYGGCLVAAHGLLQWIETSVPWQSARLMMVEGVRSSSSRRVPDHVVVAMLIADVSYCMDGDGVASQDAFLWEWHIVHGLNQDALVPLDEQQLAMAEIISRPEMSSRIADALHRKFGSWQPALLHAFSRRAAEHQQGR